MKVIGLDVGTTCVKAAVFTSEGVIEGFSQQEYNIIHSGQNAEQDAEKVWESAKTVITEVNTGDIEAICVSVQGDAVIPVDKSFKPLHNALLGMDYRTIVQTKKCSDTFGDRALFERTGMRPHPLNSLTKILWFKEEAPHIYAKTEKFMTYADYISAQLGCSPVIDYSMASRTMAFDLREMCWAKDILETLEINTDLFSEAVPSGQIIGYINGRVSSELGLKKIPIVSGGHDQVCAALGAGVTDENIVLDSHGTAEVLSATMHKPILSEIMYESFYPCYLHAKKGMYFTFALNHTAGLLFRWYRDKFAYTETVKAKEINTDPYAQIISCMHDGPSPVLVLPHFNGSGTPWCDLNSNGAIVGLKFDTDRHDIAKAILESSAFEARINIEQMKKAGIGFGELRCVGGASKSDIWMQIKADITGLRIVKPAIEQAACLGAALLALTALGAYTSVDKAVSNIVKFTEIYEPDITMQKCYDEKYAIYQKLYPALREINEMI